MSDETVMSYELPYEMRLKEYYIISGSNTKYQDLTFDRLAITNCIFKDLPQNKDCHISFTQYDDKPEFNIRMHNVKVIPSWYDHYSGLPKWLKWINSKFSNLKGD